MITTAATSATVYVIVVVAVVELVCLNANSAAKTLLLSVMMLLFDAI